MGRRAPDGEGGAGRGPVRGGAPEGARDGARNGDGAGARPGTRSGAALPDLPASELRERMGRGELSPVELLEACLARRERLDGELNAVVTLNPRLEEEARAAAARQEAALAGGRELPPLHGLPVGIKDVTETAGIRTTYGSPLYADHVPGEDALVVRRLRESGAIVLGKTNTPEFAAGGHTFNDVFGLTRNPWDPGRSAGGSTGGGAVGLATGMIALAQGTDLGGSLRIPASFCGVTGLRPTAGLVPTWPSEFLWDELQVTGFMGREAGDVALALQATAGRSPRVPVGPPGAGRDFVGAVERALEAGLAGHGAGDVGVAEGAADEAAGGGAGPPRLGYAPDVAGIGVDRDVERTCREAAEALAGAGAEVTELDLDLSFAWEAFLTLRGYWMLGHHLKHLDVLDELGPSLAGNIRAGLEITGRELGEAEAARGRMWETFRGFFTGHDFLLTPCMAVPPFPADRSYPERVGDREMETYVDWIAPTFLLSLTGLPVGSVPAGLDAGGLPVGLQVVGPPLGEERVLGLMALVERMRPLPSPPALGG